MSRAPRNDELSLYATSACLDVVTTWAETLQGSGIVSDAIARIARLVGADFCILSRFNKDDGTSLQLSAFGKDSGKLLSPRNCSSVSPEILGTNLYSAVEATVWKRSEAVLLDIDGEKSPHPGHTGQQLKEVFSIVLANTNSRVDVLEIQYCLPPSQASCAIVQLLAAALSKSWKNRLPGVARQPVMRLASERSATVEDQPDIQVLTHNNPKRLSRTEFRICVMVRDGMTVSKIASSLGIGVKTVRGHLSNIYSKVDVSGQFELLHVLISERRIDDQGERLAAV